MSIETFPRLRLYKETPQYQSSVFMTAPIDHTKPSFASFQSTDTVEHIYDACPKYSELGNFCIIAYLYVSDDCAPDSASTVRKKYSVFIYSETEPHAMYAI